MTIIASRYTDETHIPLNATLDIGQELSMPSYPSGTHYDTQMAAFLDGGGTIDPYDPYYDWTLEYAVNIKSIESEEYAQGLIDQAYSEPTQGTVANPEEHKRRTESRRKDKADKQAGEVLLDQDEKDEAKTDQKLSEYEGKCWASSDKVLKNIGKEDTVEGVMAINVATNTTWPVWTPPV